MSGPPGDLLRFGVVEEFLLVDPLTRTTVPKARAVLDDAVRVLGRRARPGFLRTQVETCTRPVGTPRDLRADLVSGRRAMLHAAAGEGCLLVATGTPVLPSRHPLPVTRTEYCQRVAAHVGRGVWDQPGGELCGCRVHLGDLRRGEALALSAHLRPWLPVLQAACVDSPFCEGEATRTASTRWERHLAWPASGPAPLLDEEGYERTVRRLVADGVVLDRGMISWAARPSDRLPTLEVRMADANADVDTVVFLAVALRGLAQVLLAEHRAGVPPPAVAGTALRAMHLQAARVGLAGTARHPATGRSVAARLALAALLERAGPGLERTGDLPLARSLAGRLLSRGTGAARQRAVLARRGSLTAVVDHLADLTAELAPARAVVTLPPL